MTREGEVLTRRKKRDEKPHHHPCSHPNRIALKMIRALTNRCVAICKRRFSTQSGDIQFKPVIKKYLDKFPLTLFRINSTKLPKFKLRELKEQEAKGSFSFDYVAFDGKIRPLEGNLFSALNGMSLRPNTQNEFTIISDRPGKTFIVEIPAGTAVPDETVLVHEFEDHFSLQPSVAMDPKKYNAKISYFLQNPAFKVYTKSEWLVAHPILLCRLLDFHFLIPVIP